MTPNKEDYLKCIYEISTQKKKITNKEIAQRMQVSPPAVTEMAKRMIEEGLIQKDKQAGYRLTLLGQNMVARLYRKHRLIEVFLLEHLGYTSHQLHEEAEVLEHTVSDYFIDQLDSFLGSPKTCPHGGTIPLKDHLLEEQYQDTLDKVTELGSYRLVRMNDSFPLLQFLEQINLALNDHFTVQQIDTFTQNILIQYKEATIAIPFAIANELYIEAT
ncbi:MULTISPECIES: metal-dependent transcriptional regulator [unclassified Streptococcus]|uniref:metal-dependent transcriptional regulator n=1 Tax=unclassified Streptococcus TaxID=2608887 RepID=UPI001071D0D2|nr:MULTISPECIES: metal-dependent transcriptional regulator [unclassified Streptococcus]MBF0787568.1 metal-dependent transcriptional regulator [Streptococcus sp. 19428wC2_LYSM12]MCQ9211407.1 metal-dependent transcriptional regulator [Streptococcus sp. B01]MCQ9214720.1 metal-dependent transcriptional regulator [Streptococcus sp. O1]TFV05517.1 metal-dependent transcriptional regulator [Streptococcus sp. LYSM12]